MQNFDLIEDYMEGRMNKNAAQVFEARLAADEALRSEYDAYRAAKKLSERFGVKALKEDLKESDLPLCSSEIDKKKKLSTRTLLLAAASLMLLAFAGLFMVSKLSQPNAEQLFTQNYSAPTFNTVRSISTTKPVFPKAKEAFFEKNYNKTIEILQNADAGLLNTPSAQALLAHSYVLGGQPQKAIATFDSLADMKSPEWSPSARWYAALTALKSENIKEAQKRLEAIKVSDPNAYGPKAEKLLSNL